MSVSKPFAYLNQKPLLSDLCEHVRTERWYMLGIQLDIDNICLNDIQVEHHPEDKRRARMFEEWLRVNPEASVSQLIEALRKESVQEDVIAYKIEKIYLSRYNGISTVIYHAPNIFIDFLIFIELRQSIREKTSTNKTGILYSILCEYNQGRI